jgi:hypothetical protein
MSAGSWLKRLLVTTGDRTYDSADLDPEGGCGQRQRELSRQLTRLVDVLYALVLVQGAVYYRSLFTIGDKFSEFELFLPVVLALALTYFTAIQSFIDYHLASEDQPYRLLDSARRRRDLWRFYLDVVIVGLYSFILLKCHVLIADPAADLRAVFWALAVIFALYLIWGTLRWRAKPDQKGSTTEQPYKPRLLWVCLGLYLGLAFAYAEMYGGWIENSAFLGGALLIMAFYRWMNWSQNRTC